MTRAILQLFDRTLATHARNVEGGELRVVTAVVPDGTREPNRALIEEVTSHAGGIFIEAADQWEGVADRGDPPLEHALASVGQPPLIEFRREGDIVLARHPDGPEPETNESARTFLGLVNALLDRRLLEAEFAVLVYDEVELDAVRAQAAWEIVTAQLRGMQLGTVRTLLVVVGAAQVSYRRHCARDRGVRFAIQGAQLLERREWGNNQADIGRLARTTDPIVLFLAAGVSASSGMPVGDTMRDAAIHRLLSFDGPSEELAERFFNYSREIDQLLTQRSNGHRLVGQDCNYLVIQVVRMPGVEARRKIVHQLPNPRRRVDQVAFSDQLLALGAKSSEFFSDPILVI